MQVMVNGVLRDATPDELEEIKGRATLPTALPPRTITPLAFRNRFTADEKASIELAALDDPQSDMPMRRKAAMLRAFLADLATATSVSLDHPVTTAGLQMLTDAGIVTLDRAELIALAPAREDERF